MYFPRCCAKILFHTLYIKNEMFSSYFEIVVTLSYIWLFVDMNWHRWKQDNLRGSERNGIVLNSTYLLAHLVFICGTFKYIMVDVFKLGRMALKGSVLIITSTIYFVGFCVSVLFQNISFFVPPSMLNCLLCYSYILSYYLTFNKGRPCCLC